MKVRIPDIGDAFVLKKAWTFSLYPERRNGDMWLKHTGKEYEYRSRDENPVKVTLEEGTALRVDRIYIRKGQKDFSSLSFNMKDGKKNLRFWAKLKEVNEIEADIVLESQTAATIKWHYFRRGYETDRVYSKQNDFKPLINSKPGQDHTVTCYVDGVEKYKCIERLVTQELMPKTIYQNGQGWSAMYRLHYTYTLYNLKGEQISDAYKSSQTIKDKVKNLENNNFENACITSHFA